METADKPHIDTSQVAVSVSINTPQSASVFSPLPNIPTFIKLYGQPESKDEKKNENDDKNNKKDEKENENDDKNNKKDEKSEVLDIIDANDEDPFTLESFLSLIMLYVKNKKDFIISRVKTADPNDETKFYYSYYAAHHINKVIFRTQPEQSLLHRMRAKNPLNNMTIVDDVYYYVIKYEEAKKVIKNIKNKLKLKNDDIIPKTPLSPLFITPIPEENEENTNEDSENRHHIRSKSSPIKFVSNISNKAPRSIQRLLVRTGMAPLQAYPELMTRNNLRLIMKPEGLEPDPIIQSTTISNDEFNSDDLYEKAMNENQQSILSKIKSSLNKKKEEPHHEMYGSSVALLTENKDINNENNGNNENNDNDNNDINKDIKLNEGKRSSIASSSNTATNPPNITVNDDSSSSNNSNDNNNSNNNPKINITNTENGNYSQYVIDLGNEAMSSEKSTTSPKSAISSCPYPVYSNNLLKIHTTSYLNDRDSKLNVYDWIKLHSTSPLSASTNLKIDSLLSKNKKNRNNDGSSVSTDETKNEEKERLTAYIDIEEEDSDKNKKNKKDDILKELKEIIFEAPFYATDDDFLMKSSVRAYFKHNALEPDDAVLFTLPTLDNAIMINGEQHPALANFNYVLDRQMQNEARVLRKINKSLKWLLLAYLIFAFVLIKIWVPTNVVVIIIAIGIFLICFFLMVCAI